MADLRPVQSYINLDAIDQENSAMVARVKKTVAEILTEFKKTKGIELKLASDPASARQIRLAIEDLQKTQQKLQKSTADLNKIRTEAIKQQLLEEKVGAQRNKRMQEEVKLSDMVAKSKAKTTAEVVREAEAAAKASSAYEGLKRRYQLAANAALELGAAQGRTSQDFLDAQTQANKLNEELLALEKSVGRNQRDVGNYAKGWSGLSNSINQISRELPSFANSVQTGFLAISNNLPIFFDEVSRANAEIKALRAQGQETQGILSRLGSAFFSLGTVLSIGVTLLTLYGDEIVKFISAAFKGTEALDKFAEKQKIINEAFKDSDVKKAYEDVTKVGIAFELAKEGVVKKEEALKLYNDTLGDSLGKAKSIEEAEEAYKKNTDSYIKAILFRTAAQLALSKASDATLAAAAALRKSDEEALTALDKFTKFGVQNSSSAPGFVPGLNNTTQDRANAAKFAKERAEERRKAEEEAEKRKALTFEQIAKDFYKQAAEAAKNIPNFSIFGDQTKTKKDGEKLLKIKREFNDRELKDRVDALKAASNVEELNVKTRSDFRQEAYELELKAIEGRKNAELFNLKQTRDAVLSDANSSKIDKLNAEREYQNELKKLNGDTNYEILKSAREFEADLVSIKLSGKARQLQQDRDIAQLAKDAFEKFSPANQLEDENQKISAKLKSRQDFLKQDADIRLKALEEDYQKQFALVKDNPEKLAALEEQTSAKRLAIQNDLNLFLLRAELDYAKEYLQILKDLGFDTVEQEAKIAEIQKKIAEGVTKSKKDEAQKQISIEEQRRDKLKELGDASKELVNAVILGTFDRRKNEIQDEIDALEKKKQKDIEVANATIQNEQDRAAAIATINARAQAQKEQLELRQRKIDQDRARYERIKAIVDIVQNTAIAITKQTKDLPASLPIIALIGAIGAAQIATVLARPIPRYATGTEDHPGGVAMVGDGGRSELAVTPDGKLIRTPSVPTLMDLPAHSIVLPDADKATQMLAKMAVRDSMLHDRLDVRGGSGSSNRELREMVRLQRMILEKPTVQPVMKNGELRTMVRNGSSWTEYVNRNI